MNTFFKKSIIFSVIAVALLAIFVFSAGAEDVDDGIYYCREAISKLDNSEALLFAYDSIAEGVGVCLEWITVYNGEDDLSAEELATVIDAYRRDYAHHFWIGNSYSVSFRDETVLRVRFDYITSGAELEAAKVKFNAAVDEILAGIDPSMSDFEKELYFHDTIAARTNYSLNGENVYNAYGALVDGVSVCEGYAEALQYLLHRVGIRSFIAIGSGRDQPHAWNCVEIDGKFYHTDLTWDDPDSVYHAYFNLSDDVIQEDHYIEPTAYALPVCDSDDAAYFKVMGGYLESYNVDLISSLLKIGTLDGNTLSKSIYIPGDVSVFWEWYCENILPIAVKTGFTGSIGYGMRHTGHEICLIIEGNLSGETFLPAKIDRASLSLGSDLTMKFYVALDGDSDLDPTKFSLCVTMCGRTEEITEYKLDGGKYVFEYTGISPQQMTDLIDIELLNSGVKIYERSGYSVKENAQKILTENGSDEKLVRLISDMLRYGEAAQKYRGYNPDDLATEGVVGMSEPMELVPTSTDKKAVFESAVNDVYFTHAGVRFDTVNRLYVRLSSSDGAKIIVKADGEIVGIYENFESTTVYTGGIAASDINTVYTFELYDNGELVETLTYSVRSYCYSMKDSENMGELALALYNYGCSAVEYGK